MCSKETGYYQSQTNLYAERDCEEQGQHYINHVMALTEEDLYGKSAIAAELAHRDIIIESLQATSTKQSAQFLAANAEIQRLSETIVEQAKEIERLRIAREALK